MEGLMAQPPERALPIIKKVLAGSQTTLVKQRALFVLSQIDSPEAQEILVQTARSSDAAMRGEAIRSIGIGGDPKSLDGLQAIYNAGGRRREGGGAAGLDDRRAQGGRVSGGAERQDRGGGEPRRSACWA